MYILNVLMRSGNKATVTKDSILPLCQYCILYQQPLGCNHTAIYTITLSLLTYVFPPSGSVTLCLSFISCAVQQIAFYSTPSVLSWDRQIYHPKSFNQQTCSQVHSVLPAAFKVSICKDVNQNVSSHHRNESGSTSALTWHLWLLLVMSWGQTPPTDSSQLDSTANGRLNVKLVLRMSIALSLHWLDTFFSAWGQVTRITKKNLP